MAATTELPKAKSADELVAGGDMPMKSSYSVTLSEGKLSSQPDIWRKQSEEAKKTEAVKKADKKILELDDEIVNVSRALNEARESKKINNKTLEDLRLQIENPSTPENVKAQLTDVWYKTRDEALVNEGNEKEIKNKAIDLQRSKSTLKKVYEVQQDLEMNRDDSFLKATGNFLSHVYNATAPAVISGTGAVIESAGDLGLIGPVSTVYESFKKGEGDNKITDIIGEALQDMGKSIKIDVDQKYSDKHYISSTIGDIVGSVITAAVPGGAVSSAGRTASLIASSVTSAMQSADDIHNQAKDAGLSDEDAGIMTLSITPIMGLMDALGAGNVVDNIAGKKMIKEIIDVSIKKLSKGEVTKDVIFEVVGDSFKTVSKKYGKNVFKSAREEGLTEGAQAEIEAGAENLYDVVTGKESYGTKIFSVKEQLNVAKQAAIGAVAGGPLGLLSGISSPKNIYQKAMSLKDNPSKLAEFQSLLDTEEKAGHITPEQTKNIANNITSMLEADKKIPSQVTDVNKRFQAVELIKEKNNIQSEMANVDPSMAAPLKSRLNEINSDLELIAQGKERVSMKRAPFEAKIQEKAIADIDTQISAAQSSMEGKTETEKKSIQDNINKLTEQKDAIQKQSTGGLLQPETGRVGEPGGKRGTLEQGVEGAEAAKEGEVKPKATKEVAKAEAVKETTDAAAYSQAITAAKQELAKDEKRTDLQVSDVSQDEAQKIIDEGGKLFITEDNMSGGYVKPDGYMGGLFKNPKSALKSVSKVLQQARMKVGGKFFDAFATKLEDIYIENGFRPVARLKFNEAYAPEGWDSPGSVLKDKPDVVFFAYDPDGTYAKGEGEMFTDYDEAYEFAKNHKATAKPKTEAKVSEKAEAKPEPLTKSEKARYDILKSKEKRGKATAADKANIAKYEEKINQGGIIERTKAAVDNVVKSLKNLSPDTKVTTHDTPESFSKSAEDAGADAQESKNAGGFFDPETNTIHLNLQKIKSNTLFHEGIHPILNVISAVKPEMINKLFEQVKKAESRAGKKGEYSSEFASRYEVEGQAKGEVTPLQKMEAITEFLADVADGTIEVNETNFDKVKQVVIDMFNAVGIDISSKITTIADLKKLAAEISKGFETGEVINLNDYMDKAEELNSSDSIDIKSTVEKSSGSGTKPLFSLSSGDKNVLDIAKENIVSIKDLIGKKISKVAFYDNTRVGKLEIKNRNTGYTPDVDGKGGFLYSFMPESVKNQAVLAFTSVNQAMQALQRQIMFPKSIQAIAMQNRLTSHLGNKSTLEALFGQGKGIFQEAAKNAKQEAEILDTIKKSIKDLSTKNSEDGTNMAKLLAKVDLNKIKTLDQFRDKVLLSEGDSFSTRGTIFKYLLQEKITKITKSTRSEHEILHHKYGIPTLSEIAEGNNQKQFDNAQTGDVVKFVKPSVEPVIYTTDKALFEQYSKSPTKEMKASGISIRLLPESQRHESYPFVLVGENVGLLSEYISGTHLYKEHKNLPKAKSFYTLGRMKKLAAAGEVPADITTEGKLQFQKPQKEVTSLNIDGKDVKVKETQLDVVNGFYSPLEKVISETKSEKLPAKQWIEKFAKGEEAKWTGLADWLSQQQGSVSKSDIQQYLKDNRVSVVEVVKEGETKFSKYQLEGEKSNYKEVLVTMPSLGSAENIRAERIGGSTTWNVYIGNSEYSTRVTNAVTKEQAIKKAKVDNPKFKSSHFDEPNILVHLRMNTRTDAQGNKVLFLEEVQSDWGQTGKKEGFATNEKEEAKKIEDEIRVKYNLKPSDKIIGNNKVSQDEQLRLSGANIKKGNVIPQAPFVTDTNAWTKLGLKVALKEAVKQGADKIAWTTGEQQNERYDLSKQVDNLEWNPKTGSLVGYKDDSESFKQTGVTEDKLEDYVGKEAAKKLIEKEINNGVKRLENADLKVGGKGMKGFYGSPKEGSLGIVGSVAKSLFKQEPKTTEINGEQQNSIDVTPELKESVARGLPQFQKPKKGDDLVEKAGKRKEMTEDDKGNYLFFHYSNAKFNKLNPEKVGKHLATSRGETPAKKMSMLYTRPDRLEPGVPSENGYVVRVPKNKVYHFNTDPLNLLPEAEKLFRKENGKDKSFDLNNQVAYVAKVAAQKGFPVTTSDWNIKGTKALRAQTTEVLPVEKYSNIKPGTTNQVQFNPEFENVKPNAKRRDIQYSLEGESLETALDRALEVAKNSSIEEGLAEFKESEYFKNQDEDIQAELEEYFKEEAGTTEKDVLVDKFDALDDITKQLDAGLKNNERNELRSKRNAIFDENPELKEIFFNFSKITKKLEEKGDLKKSRPDCP